MLARRPEVLTEIHVVEEGGAGPGHLAHGEGIAAPELRFVEFRLPGPDIILKPALQGIIIPIAAQQGHRGVGVGIVQPRQDRLPVAVHHDLRNGAFGCGKALETLAFDKYIPFLSVQKDVLDQDAFHSVNMKSCTR